MTRLHKEELEKTNSQNMEQRHEKEFLQWFKKSCKYEFIYVHYL